MSTLREIVFDCDHPAVLAKFWAAVLDGYRVREYDAAEIARLARLGLTPESDPTVLLDGPGPLLCFQPVPGRCRDNSRLHLDVAARDPKAEVVRLRALGAAVQRTTDDYVVLCDPEGNQFCVVATDAHRTGAN